MERKKKVNEVENRKRSKPADLTQLGGSYSEKETKPS